MNNLIDSLTRIFETDYEILYPTLLLILLLVLLNDKIN